MRICNHCGHPIEKDAPHLTIEVADQRFDTNLGAMRVHRELSVVDYCLGCTELFDFESTTVTLLAGQR